MKSVIFPLALSLSLLLFSGSLTVASADDKEGRAGAWRKGTQGAPSLKTARARVDKSPKDPEALNDLGFALRQNGKLEEAEKYLKQAVELKDDLGEAHANLSVVYFDEGKFPEALSSARRAVNINANNAIFRVVLGNALSKTGDLKGAAQEYKIAIHLQPDYENAHYNLGRVLCEDGESNEGKYSLSKALELDPKDDRVIMLLDKLERGESISGTAASPASGGKKSSAASAPEKGAKTAGAK